MWFILEPQFHNDKGYAIFGKTIKGTSVIDRIGDVDVTCTRCDPMPYMPLRPINILDLHLEIKEEE